MAALIFAEGVLWASSDRPILEGFRLVGVVGTTERLVVCTSGPEARLMHQLRTERLQDLVDVILDETEDLPPHPLWKRQFEVARSQGPLSMVITSELERFDWAVEHGIPGLLFAHPRFAAPPRRPEVGARNWEDVLEEVEARP